MQDTLKVDPFPFTVTLTTPDGKNIRYSCVGKDKADTDFKQWGFKEESNLRPEVAVGETCELKKFVNHMVGTMKYTCDGSRCKQDTLKVDPFPFTVTLTTPDGKNIRYSCVGKDKADTDFKQWG